MSLPPHFSRLPVALVATLLATTPVLSQTRPFAEQVRFVSPRDGTELTGWLSLPEGSGPHSALVLLSVAGTDPFVDRMVSEGYVVLTPSLRGFVRVEPLLRASYADLAGDVGAAVGYLRSLAAVDTAVVAVVAQGDNAPQAMLYAATADPTVPLVLLAPPAFPGVESFRLEQRWIAENQGIGAEGLEALDVYVTEIGEIVLGESDPFRRQVELERLRARSPVELPRNAAFPADEGQMRFLASRFWRDRLAFEPEDALAELAAPVLLLVGADEANTPVARYLRAVRRGLGAAPTDDATVCRVPGRTRHAFSRAALDAIAAWLPARLRADADGGPGPPSPGGCLRDDEP